MPGSFDKKFVILTSARTGSNALVNALTNHPDIHCDFEIYHEFQIYTAGDNAFTLEERNGDPVLFLDKVQSLAKDRAPENKPMVSSFLGTTIAKFTTM